MLWSCSCKRGEGTVGSPRSICRIKTAPESLCCARAADSRLQPSLRMIYVHIHKRHSQVPIPPVCYLKKRKLRSVCWGWDVSRKKVKLGSLCRLADVAIIQRVECAVFKWFKDSERCQSAVMEERLTLSQPGGWFRFEVMVNWLSVCVTSVG